MDNDNNEKSKSKTPIIVFIIIAIIVVVIALLLFNIFKGNNGKTLFNKNEVANEKDIIIKVNSVEEVQTKEFLDEYNRNYVKVNVSITNKGKENTTISPVQSFELLDASGNKIYCDIFIDDEDILEGGELSSNSTMTGNLYFETKLEKEMKLQYSVPVNVKETDDGKITYEMKEYSTINLD